MHRWPGGQRTPLQASPGFACTAPGEVGVCAEAPATSQMAAVSSTNLNRDMTGSSYSGGCQHKPIFSTDFILPNQQDMNG